MPSPNAAMGVGGGGQLPCHECRDSAMGLAFLVGAWDGTRYPRTRPRPPAGPVWTTEGRAAP